MGGDDQFIPVIKQQIRIARSWQGIFQRLLAGKLQAFFHMVDYRQLIATIDQIQRFFSGRQPADAEISLIYNRNTVAVKISDGNSIRVESQVNRSQF